MVNLNGDGSPAAIGAAVNHTYAAIGSYTATTVVAVKTGLSYTWDFGDGTISTKSVGAGDSAAVMHTYAVAGNYAVKVTATNTNGSATTQKVFAVVATQRKVFVRW